MKDNSHVTASPPDLKRPTESLASGIQAATMALYRLHTVLVNSTVDDTSATLLLAQFRSGRDLFREECEQILHFLRYYHGHIDDFVFLCEAVGNDSPVEEYKRFAEDMLEGTRQILADARELAKNHRLGYEQLLEGENSARYHLQQASVRQWSDPGPLPGDLPAIAESAQHPDGVKSLEEALASLRDIDTSLEDTVVFWQEHCTFLHNFIANKVLLDVAAEAQWKDYRQATSDAMSSISMSSDAVAVDAVVLPRPDMLQAVALPLIASPRWPPFSLITVKWFWDLGLSITQMASHILAYLKTTRSS